MAPKREDVVVRIAPSPTGNLHVGTARSALFNYIFARKTGGKFLTRIEDTDKERSRPEYEANIKEGLAWLLGEDWNKDGEGEYCDRDRCYKQSERTALYTEALTRMIGSGAAYVSKETPTEPGGRTEVIRIKNPGKDITFHDIVRGDITFNTKELGDFVIAKSLEEPLYHFAVVVDDHLMGVTHVIRGDDHISNTPRQILIQEALGAPRPIYCHLPLILAPDRSKLSKRHGAVALTEYRDRGYLSDALFNYLALLSWNPGEDRDRTPMSRAEIIDLFSLERIQKSGAIFDITKLNSLNSHYLRSLGKDAWLDYLARTGIIAALEERPGYAEHRDRFTPYLLTILQQSMVNADENKEKIRSGEFDYFFALPSIDPTKLMWKNEPSAEKTRERLIAVEHILEGSDWTSDATLKAAVWPFAEKDGRGEVLWPLRYALTGRERSPEPFFILSSLGKDESIKRIKSAIELLGE